MNEGEEVAPQPEAEARTNNLDFPTPPGQGFSQFDPKTGWAWIGIHLPSFSFRDAWSFIKSQEYMISSTYTKIDQERAMRAQIANAPAKSKNGIAAMAQRLGLKI